MKAGFNFYFISAIDQISDTVIVISAETTSNNFEFFYTVDSWTTNKPMSKNVDFNI